MKCKILYPFRCVLMTAQMKDTSFSINEKKREKNHRLRKGKLNGLEKHQFKDIYFDNFFHC